MLRCADIQAARSHYFAFFPDGDRGGLDGSPWLEDHPRLEPRAP